MAFWHGHRTSLPSKPYIIPSTPYFILSAPYIIPSKPYIIPKMGHNPFRHKGFFALKLEKNFK